MSFRRQSSLIFLGSLFQLAFAFVSGIVTARLLGPEGKGIVYMTFFVPALIVSLGSLSLGEAATYFIGKGLPARRVAGNTILQALLMGSLYATLAFLALAFLKATVYKDVPILYAAAGLLLIPVMMLKYFGDGVLTGMQRIRQFVIGNLLLHAIKATLLFTLLFVLKLGVGAAVAAEFSAWMVTGIYYFVAIQRGHGLDWKLDWPLTRDAVRYGGQTHVGNLSQRLNLQLDVTILGSVSGAASVGLYSVAVNLAQMLWYIPDAIGRILFPRVARSTPEEAGRITALACRNTILLTLLAAGVLFLVARPAIRLLYGAEFLDAVMPLFLLLPGIVALSVSKVLTKYLSGIGKPFLNSVASMVALAVNVPLLYVLIRSHDIRGAAIASSVAYTVQALVVIFFYIRESHTRVGPTLTPTPKDFHLYAESASGLWRRLRTGKMAAP